MYGLGDNRRALGVLANVTVDGKHRKPVIMKWEINWNWFVRKIQKTTDFIRSKFAIPQQVVSIEEGSVLIVDD